MIVKDTLLPIEEVAAKLGLSRERLYPYGPHMAKVLGEPPKARGRLILVTAITPTPAGEGKTTTPSAWWTPCGAWGSGRPWPCGSLLRPRLRG